MDIGRPPELCGELAKSNVNADRLEDQQFGLAQSPSNRPTQLLASPKEVAVMKSMSVLPAEHSSLPNIETIGRLFVGGFAGLMIWEFWARVITVAISAALWNRRGW